MAHETKHGRLRGSGRALIPCGGGGADELGGVPERGDGDANEVREEKAR